MDVDDFLKAVGKRGETYQDNKTAKWYDIIRPETVSIILGRKGMGKSAVAYWLCDEMATAHNLLRVVINLPRERQELLPPNFVVRTLADIPRISNGAIIIDEGTTMLPAGGKKLEDMVKGFVALSRQRNQMILFIFHSSSDVGSRILRGVDAILLKEPSLRQIQHGSKDSWWRELLIEAKEKFEALADMGANPKEFTFVDSETPEFRGMLPNPLPAFWSEDLSKAWAGLDTLWIEGYHLSITGPEGIEKKPEFFALIPRFRGQRIIGFSVQDPHRAVIGLRSILVNKIHSDYPEITIEQLDNAQISYYDYHAEVDL